jgi:hypothetical protein
MSSEQRFVFEIFNRWVWGSERLSFTEKLRSRYTHVGESRDVGILLAVKYSSVQWVPQRVMVLKAG